MEKQKDKQLNDNESSAFQMRRESALPALQQLPAPQRIETHKFISLKCIQAEI